MPHKFSQKPQSLKKRLDDLGLAAEFVAPRLWEDPMTIDGGYTSNDPECRKYAIERSKVSIDIANALGTDLTGIMAGQGRHLHPGSKG